MARSDPQVNLRMSEDLKQALEKAASENNRSLTAEIIARLRDSLRPDSVVSEMNLAPTVVRLERDLAKVEMEKAYQTLTVWLVASTLKPLLDASNPNAPIAGPLGDMTAEKWRDLCDAYIRRSNIPRSELDTAFERMRDAEGKLRAVDAVNADPVWENMRALRSAMQHSSEESSEPFPPQQKLAE